MPKAGRRPKKGAQGGGEGFLNLRSRKVVRVARTSVASPRQPGSKVAKASKGRTTRPKVSTASCVVCGDDEDILDGGWIKAPCTHTYCPQCVEFLVAKYTRDESLHPISCCNKPIPKSNVEKILSRMGDPARHSLFQDKYEEYSTPAGKRTYCPHRKCSKFISRKSTRGDYFICPSCSSEVCKHCKELAHPGNICGPDNQELFLQLAKKNKWQACPKCGWMIEKVHGCLHMICRCGGHFCYACGGNPNDQNHQCRL